MVCEIHGAALSPFVRKTRIFHVEKGIEYKAVHVDPNALPEGYERLNPLMRVPAYVDDHITLADSAVICAYVEKRHPEPPLYPLEPVNYARALWFEKYADYELAPFTTFSVFRNRVVMPLIGKPADDEKIHYALETALPPMYDYLEAHLQDREFIVGENLSIADIAIGSQFANLKLGNEYVSERRWPTLATYIERLHKRPSFAQFLEKELVFVARLREKPQG